MRQARIFIHNIPAGILTEINRNEYHVEYNPNYTGQPISLTMPIQNKLFHFNKFPPFFEGLLPEGMMLEALLRRNKINKDDYFSQLMLTGEDMIGAVTVKEIT